MTILTWEQTLWCIWCVLTIGSPQIALEDKERVEGIITTNVPWCNETEACKNMAPLDAVIQHHPLIFTHYDMLLPNKKYICIYIYITYITLATVRSALYSDSTLSILIAMADGDLIRSLQKDESAIELLPFIFCSNKPSGCHWSHILFARLRVLSDGICPSGWIPCSKPLLAQRCVGKMWNIGTQVSL